MSKNLSIYFIISLLWTSTPSKNCLAANFETNALAVSSGLLQALFDEARTNNAGVRVAEARFQQAQAGIATVREWEDPLVSMGAAVAGDRRGGLRQEGDLIYGLAQRLPLWNRPGLSRAIAVAESATQGAAAAYREQMLRSELTKALLRLALVSRNLDFGTNDLSWLNTQVQLQEERFRFAAGSHTDLLALQNERSRRTDVIQTERNRLRMEESAINRLMGRDLSQTWPQVQLPRLLPNIPYFAALADYAVTNDARAKILREEVARSQAVTQLTKTDRLPTVSVGLMARQYSGDAGIREGQLTVNFSLPWMNAPKYRADLVRSEAKVRTLEAELADYELGLREEVLRLTLAAETAARGAVLNRDEIYQRLQQAMASHLVMWESRQGQLRDVLDTRRAALEAQIMIERATAEQHLALADLAALCGLPDHFQLARLVRELGGPPTHRHPDSLLPSKQ